MYEVGHIKSISDIPDNISNILTELKEFKEKFKIQIDFCKDTYKIELLEYASNRKFSTTRYLLLEITENPCSYSIHLFDNRSRNSNNKELEPIYEIEVEGENDFKLIKKDVKDLIEGKKGASFFPNYPL